MWACHGMTFAFHGHFLRALGLPGIWNLSDGVGLKDMMEFYVLSQRQAAAGLLGSRLWDRVVTEALSSDSSVEPGGG